MAQIVQRLVNWTPDAAIELRGETWSRKLPFGNNWSKIRVAVIASIGVPSVGLSRFSAPTITGSAFFTGVCNSVNPFGFTSQSAIGVSWLGNPAPPWTASTLTLTANSATGPRSYSCNVSPYSLNKYYDVADPVQVTLSGVTFTSTAISINVHDEAPRRRSFFAFDLTRLKGGGGGAAASSTIYHDSTATSTADVTLADAIDFVTQSTGGVVGGTTVTTKSLALSIGESHDAYDSVFVHWTNAAVPLYIHGIVACCWAESMSPELGYDTQMGASESFSMHGTTEGTWTPGDDLYTPMLVSFLGGVPGWPNDSSWYSTGSNANLSPQYGAYYGTSGGNPIDTFTQYVLTSDGSLPTGYLNAGSGFTAPWVTHGTLAYEAKACVMLAGTSSGMPFIGEEHWPTPGGTIAPGEFYEGLGWAYTAIFNGSYAGTTSNSDAVYFGYGTTGGNPNDQFLQYITGGTLTSGVSDAGTYWASPIYIGGTNSDSYEIGAWEFGGTAQKFPWETFEQYDTGTVGVSVFITAGTGWGSDGTVHVGPF